MRNAALSEADILAQIPGARAREAQARTHGLRATSARYDRTAERVVLEYCVDLAHSPTRRPSTK